MAHIWIRETHGKFNVTVNEYPEIVFSEKTYKKARDKAVKLVKAETEKNMPKMVQDEEVKKTTIGFAA